MENRQFQLDARRQINTLLNASRHPVYLAPCGTGKTYTAAQIIADRISLQRRVYVLVPQVEIFDEWMKVLSEFGLNPGYINDEGVRGKNRGVYVCMTLSLINLLPVLPESIYPDEIITDEMQHSLAASWEQVYQHFGQALRIGLTATLYHGSPRSFEHLYTDVVQTISKSQAIDQEYITKPLLVIPEKWVSDVPMNGDDFDIEEQAKILGKPKIIGNVIDFYERTFEGKPVIVPCPTFGLSKTVVEAFGERGWKFEHLHSGLGKHERKRILRSVAAGKINGICTVGIGIEGMSIHGLYGVLWLRRTASPIIWTQFNGRAERVVKGKKYYICADFVGNSVIHGMPDRDLFWTLEQDDRELPEPDDERPVMVECWHCGVMNSGLNEICHFCGEPLQGELTDGDDREQSFPAIEDGELV
ncbi:MAG: DEAD/DEAH box helicase family protein, partial [Deltaproteobacteria bacterium]|nr:DEAD/DEAH box helicase family protein [Deltaproteobacteria bacterium]